MNYHTAWLEFMMEVLTCAQSMATFHVRYCRKQFVWGKQQNIFSVRADLHVHCFKYIADN